MAAEKQSISEEKVKSCFHRNERFRDVVVADEDVLVDRPPSK